MYTETKHMLLILLLAFQAYLFICVLRYDDPARTCTGRWTPGFKTRQVTIGHMIIWVCLVPAQSSPAILFWPFSHYWLFCIFFYPDKMCSPCVCFLAPISVKNPRTLPVKSQERVLVTLQTALAGCYEHSSVKNTLYDSIWPKLK